MSDVEKPAIHLKVNIEGFEALRESIGDDDAMRILRRELIEAGDAVARSLRLPKGVRVETDLDGHEVMHLEERPRNIR